MNLEIGLTPWREPPATGPDASFADQAVRAEELGFDSLFVPESHFFAGALPAPLVLLSYAAARTGRLKLGTTSLLLPVRNPVLLAEEIAMLDRLSAGRLILGVGRGFRRALFDVLEIDETKKRTLLEQSLERMKAAWAGEPLLSGEWSDTSQGPRMFPVPEQDPHPPLWMAAFGPKALQQAARLEMPYLASPLECTAQLAENYSALERAADDLGLPSPRTRPLMRTVFINDDEGVCKRVREGLAVEHDAWKKTAAPALRRSLEAPLAERVLVGSREWVERAIATLAQQLKVTHIIARCLVPEATAGEVEASVECLAALLPKAPP